MNGYEEGYDDVSPEQISVAKISLNTGKHRWEGRHGELRDLTKGSPEPPDVVEALVLGRSSQLTLKKSPSLRFFQLAAP